LAATQLLLQGDAAALGLGDHLVVAWSRFASLGVNEEKLFLHTEAG
jgi:hypothetical protein